MPETPSIYFSTLEIENVRCFRGRQLLNLTTNGQPAQWTLLIGENGTGKTTLLECLAWMRPVPDVNGTSAVPAGPEYLRRYVPFSSGRLKSDLSSEENKVLETLPRVGSRAVSLAGKFSFGGVGFGPQRARSQAKDFHIAVNLSFDEQASLLELKEKRAQIKRLGDPFHDPVLMISYGANRLLGERNLLDVEEPGPRHHERLSRDTKLFDAQEILMRLDYAAKTNLSGLEESRLKQLKETIATILPDIQDAERIRIYPLMY